MFCFEWRVRLQAPTGTILSTNNKCQKRRRPNWKWNNFFQQILSEKWLKQTWFSDKQWITFVSWVFTAIQVWVTLVMDFPLSYYSKTFWHDHFFKPVTCPIILSHYLGARYMYFKFIWEICMPPEPFWQSLHKARRNQA